MYIKIFLFIYFENDSMWAGEGQRDGGERIASRLHAVSTEPNVGLELANHEIMTWTKIKSQTLNWLSHPGTLIICTFFFNVYFLGEKKR